MFDKLFGWSKAKKAIKCALYKIRILKTRRQTMVKQIRKDLIELIQSGYEKAAINRVELLMEDESLAVAYELLDNFCEFILTQLSYIRKHKDCPDDIKKAISSLIFASARCGDIPQLFVIRKLFGKCYGEKFAIEAVELLLPGNLVNKQLQENLSRKYVPEDLKYKIVDEIARDNCLQEKVLAIEYYPDGHQMQLKENKGYELVESDAQINASISESEFHPSEIEEIESFAHSSAIVSPVQQYPQCTLRYSMQNEVEKVYFPKALSSVNSSLQNKGERLASSKSSSEERTSFPSYPDEMIDYVDDIEECQFSLPKVDACQDEMLLKFNSSGLVTKEKTQFGYNESDLDQDELSSESSSTMISRKRLSRKRSRRRSSCLKNLGIVDVGYKVYYQKPCRSPSSNKDVNAHDSRKDQKPSLEGTSPSSYSQEKVIQQSFFEKENNLQSCQSEDSSQLRLGPTEEARLLQHDESNIESQQEEVSTFCVRPCLEQDYIISRGSNHCRPFCDDDLNKAMEQVTIPQRQYSNGNNETKAKTNDSLTRIKTKGTFSKARTMPQDRQRNGKDKMSRTNSCPSQYHNHVHPKLPDYDDIAAKFNALKTEGGTT